jgi:hypothetical protein
MEGAQDDLEVIVEATPLDRHFRQRLNLWDE